MTEIPEEYHRQAAMWDEGGENYGRPYGEPHELAEGEPPFDPMHPSAEWLEFRYFSHWHIGPTSDWPERPWNPKG